jgi:hypothetical protein
MRAVQAFSAAGICLNSASLPRGNSPQARHRQSRSIGLLQGAREPCGCAAPHALVVWVAVKGRQHTPDQVVGSKRLAGERFLDADGLAGNGINKFTVL